ncbi:hypothetical protein OAC76_01530 [Amylibacter sp.]|nr:hypothetical protein [Amylibacter sp.]
MHRITLLQLDTQFPRIPGDVGSVDTFKCDLEIIRVPNATVKEVVNSNPNQIDLDPFFNAINKATGDLITTSCGFLSPFQSELDAICNVPFIASSLVQLEHLKNICTPPELQIITFDAVKLGVAHLPEKCEDFARSIYGLNSNAHLRNVIENNIKQLDPVKAAIDVCAVVEQNNNKLVKSILLECTNLPPYKSEIRRISNVPIYDILTAIENELPNSVQTNFL